MMKVKSIKSLKWEGRGFRHVATNGGVSMGEKTSYEEGGKKEADHKGERRMGTGSRHVLRAYRFEYDGSQFGTEGKQRTRRVTSVMGRILRGGYQASRRLDST
jgi:hypothetical protein